MGHRLIVPLGCLLALPAIASGQVSCGDTIPKGRTVTLTANLGPCSDGPAALTVDGGRLDLGGFTVTCAGDGTSGISLVGKKSKLANGSVERCQDGVVLAGEGKHRVSDIEAVDNTDDGFEVDSNKNRITGSFADRNGDDGINISSDQNQVIDFVAQRSGEDGVDLTSTAERNTVKGAQILFNGTDGLEVSGNRNKLIACTVSANTRSGFDLGGEKNLVRGGTAQDNGEFDLRDCTGNKVKRVTFTTTSPDCP